MNSTNYDQLIITSTYKTANNNIMAGKNLKRVKEVIKRMETNEEGNSFISIKYQKENFNNHPTVQLISPAENEFGRISKQIKNRKLRKFATFDIKEFYQFRKEFLLKIL